MHGHTKTACGTAGRAQLNATHNSSTSASRYAAKACMTAVDEDGFPHNIALSPPPRQHTPTGVAEAT
jgi:RES domain-containing protein